MNHINMPGRTFLTLFLICIGIGLQAQNFKTNLLAPFSLGYEHFLPDHRAAQLSLQYKPSNLFGDDANRFRLGLEYRIYRGRKIKLLDKITHQQRGRFIAPYTRYSWCSTQIDGEKVESGQWSVGALAGYKRYHFKRYVAEAFIGAGISPWVQTTDAVLLPKSNFRLELQLGLVIGLSQRKSKPVFKSGGEKAK